MNKFKGTTADQMNYKASQGYVNEADLDEWAQTQNPNLMSIRWYVDYYYETRKSGSSTMKLKIPILLSECI